MEMTILRILTYTPSIESARTIAAGLLDARLVACANIGAGFESHYVWDGTREVAAEVQLWLKTRTDLRGAVVARLRALHPYDVPLIALEEIEVNADYAEWVTEQTS